MNWYREVYLKSEDWANLRAAAIAERAPDGRCRICDAHDHLDVHHLTYRKLYDVRVSDLVPLCRTCHEAVHDALSRQPPECRRAHTHFILGRRALRKVWRRRGVKSRRQEVLGRFDRARSKSRKLEKLISKAQVYVCQVKMRPFQSKWVAHLVDQEVYICRMIRRRVCYMRFAEQVKNYLRVASTHAILSAPSSK